MTESPVYITCTANKHTHKYAAGQSANADVFGDVVVHVVLIAFVAFDAFAEGHVQEVRTLVAALLHVDVLEQSLAEHAYPGERAVIYSY